MEINGNTINQPRGIAPGDEIVLGSSTIAVTLSSVDPSMAGLQWRLVPISAPEPGLDLTKAIAVVGRSDDVALKIEDDHVSRRHAELWINGYVWLRDLASANGTSVNGQRVHGVLRLFHGDYIGFDNHRYQLVASGGDVTPVLSAAEALPTPYDNSEFERPNQK